ncbi:hypothetical protein N9V27_00960 [bacterium]|nr:hypothetical protein [bacterium]
MNTLVKHIEALNIKTQEWVDAGPDRWAGMLSTDAKHWAEYNVTTPAELDRYLDTQDLYEVISDCTSKSYARSEIARLETVSEEEFKKEQDYWFAQSKIAFDEEVIAKAEAVADFEAEVNICLEAGATDRATALRWLTQDERFYHSQDVEHWVWNKGILFTPEGKAVCKELEVLIEYDEVA